MRKFTFFFVFMLLTYSLVAQIALTNFRTTWKNVDNGFDQGLTWSSLAYNGASLKTSIGNFNNYSSHAVAPVGYIPDLSNNFDTTYIRIAPDTAGSATIKIIDQTDRIQEKILSYGFASVTPLTPFPISDYTSDKPQSKVWKYADKWWCVIPNGSKGVMILRLDGTSWTYTLTIRATDNARADCRVVGDLVHILLYKGASQNSFLTTVQYDPAIGKYKMWEQRPENVTLVFPPDSETATIVVDTKGRMWLASDGTSEMTVRWSDAPYTTWSAPITIASGAKDDDICTLVVLPSLGKIGLFWSNQNSQRFGFKTHIDGANPSSWSADEVPASQSAQKIKYGMADDHMNIIVASDGTMFCGVKTGYNTPGYPQLALLVRRPSGSWDNLYPVTLGEGTQPRIVLNEAKGTVKIIYTTHENGGDIMYKESSTSKISWGEPVTLISEGGYLYNYATSTHQTYDPEVVILATQQSTSPMQAVSILARDTISTKITDPQNPVPPTDLQINLMVYPNPFPGSTTVSFILAQDSEYSINLYDMKGARISVLRSGWAEAGQLNTFSMEGNTISSGMYLLKLETANGTRVTKLIKK